MCGAELHSLPESVQRVARALQDKGHPHLPVMLDDAARTAQQAADALGVVRGADRQEHHLPPQVRRRGGAGHHQRRPARGREEGGPRWWARLGRADADFVKARTGFTIGGVSPLAHATPPVTLIDRELFRFDVIWAAAGHPHGVFRLHPTDLRAADRRPAGGCGHIGTLRRLLAHASTKLRPGARWRMRTSVHVWSRIEQQDSSAPSPWADGPP
jgi:hypothetical protein